MCLSGGVLPAASEWRLSVLEDRITHHPIHGNPLSGPSFPTLQSGANNSAFNLLLSS